MPKKAKIGKNRRDKFYSIAKEVGYRARSAFKLVQLNRKFQFLQNSRVLIDLCAAPGGWLQVAKQHMPVESKICGVDLVPIKAITGVTTFQEDITTDSCRSKLRAHLKDWKADVVLNDGAPNVGKNWHLDAFAQSEITLKALQLAAFFLKPKGWFITKVFRSNDYNALTWVMKQLFTKVHATKPAASRNESAEIFIVCQGYRAPSKIDPKFFDIKMALAQVETDQKRVLIKDFEPGKKRKATGYEDGIGSLLYKEQTDIEFFECEEPLEFLHKTNKINITKSHAEQHPLLYNVDILDDCNDLKVVEKKSVRKLLKWREKMRAELKIEGDEDKDEDEEEKEEEEELDSDEEAEKKMEKEEMQIMRDQITDMRSKKRKREKALRGLRDMIQNTVKLDQVDDVELFSLKTAPTAVNDESFAAEHDRQADADSEGEELDEGEEDELPDHFKNDEKRFDMDEQTNELCVSLEHPDVAADRTTATWFEQDDWFEGVEDGDDRETIEKILAKQKKKAAGVQAKEKKPKTKKNAGEDESMEIDQEIDQAAAEAELSSDSSDSDDSDSEDEEARQQLRDMEARIGVIPERRDDKLGKRQEKEEKRKREQFPLTPEQLAVATEMVTSKLSKRNLEERMYDRYAFNDPAGLPDWFTEQEKKHRFRRAPEVSKELVEMYKERQKAANVKTIKKVVEAKARKKRKAMKKMENARKAAEGVLSQDDVTSKEKMAQVKRIYRKAGAGKAEKEHITYVPVKQGAGKKVSRPAGVKGKFKVVDSRMKCDMRAEKAKERRAGKRPSGGRGLNPMKRKSQRR